LSPRERGILIEGRGGDGGNTLFCIENGGKGEMMLRNRGAKEEAKKDLFELDGRRRASKGRKKGVLIRREEH